jgi:hypothetical protein
MITYEFFGVKQRSPQLAQKQGWPAVSVAAVWGKKIIFFGAAAD